MRKSDRIHVNINKFLDVAINMAGQVEKAEDDDREFQIYKLKMFLENGQELIKEENLTTLLLSRTVIADNIIKYFSAQGFRYFSLTDQDKSKTTWNLCIAMHGNFQDLYSFNYVISVEDEKIELVFKKALKQYQKNIEEAKQKIVIEKEKEREEIKFKEKRFKNKSFDISNLKNKNSCDGCPFLMALNYWEYTVNQKKVHAFHCVYYDLKLSNELITQPNPGGIYAKALRPEICKSEKQNNRKSTY